MKNSCPISYEQVNENLLRLNSFIIFSFFLAIVFTPAKWLIIPVTLDFFIRIYFGVNKSPLCKLLQYVLNIFNIEPCMINAGPKRFAAKLGFIFSLVTALFYLTNFPLAVNILSIVMAVLTGLEAFTGICIGCKIYGILTSMGIKIK